MAIGVYKRTEKHLRLLAKARERAVEVNTGKHRSEETKRKISEAQRGKFVPEATRQRQRDAKLRNPVRHWAGKTRPNLKDTGSAETMFKKGQVPWIKGKKHSKKAREKMRQSALKGRKPVSSFGRTIRNSQKYIGWRKAVLEKDDYTCRVCGRRGGRLHTDHVKPLSVIIRENDLDTIWDAIDCEELWELDNGRALCVKCHRLTPTWGNREDLCQKNK